MPKVSPGTVDNVPREGRPTVPANDSRTHVVTMQVTARAGGTGSGARRPFAGIEANVPPTAADVPVL